MIRHLHSVRGIAREIAGAANGALEAYRSGRVEEEPQITDRIIGAIEDRIGPDSPLSKAEFDSLVLPVESERVTSGPCCINHRTSAEYPYP